jgi:hypothetical protein
LTLMMLGLLPVLRNCSRHQISWLPLLPSTPSHWKPKSAASPPATSTIMLSM